VFHQNRQKSIIFVSTAGSIDIPDRSEDAKLIQFSIFLGIFWQMDRWGLE
jgi:hypothetical protein